MAEPRGATSGEEGAWEVLAQPTADPAELVPYSPGPQDGPDPVTVVMTESRIRIQTFESGWTLAGAAVWAVGWLGLSPWLLFGAGGLPDPPSWILMTFASTGIAGVLLWAVGAIRRRAPRRSVIRLTNEGLSVTTSTGAIHRVTRQDIAVLPVPQLRGRQKSTVVTPPAMFEIVAVVLGVMFTVTAAFGSFLSSSDGAAFLIGLPFFGAAVLLRLFRTIWPPTESTVWLSAEGMRVCAADGGEHQALWADLRSFTRSTASDGRDTVHLTWELVDGKRADIVLGESFDTTVLDTALQEASGSRFGPTPASPGRIRSEYSEGSFRDATRRTGRARRDPST